MASSNPFRSKGSHLVSRFSTASPIDTGSPASTPSPQPPHTSFRTSPEASGSAEKKPKVVKKVRVLSPPPISPDSPEWPSNPAPVFSPNANDPFGNGLYEQTDRDTLPPLLQQPQFPLQLPLQPRQNAAPPANPFSKTLHDMENAKKEGLKEERRDEGAALKAASKARASLDVNSFQRLLMTGKTFCARKEELSGKFTTHARGRGVGLECHSTIWIQKEGTASTTELSPWEKHQAWF
ncbi:unnamed protein product, partial [Clonostachys byssicola]